MNKMFKQGDSKIKCTIIDYFDTNNVVFALIDSSFVDENNRLHSHLVDVFVDIVENEVFSFYEKTDETDFNSYKYSFENV